MLPLFVFFYTVVLRPAQAQWGQNKAPGQGPTLRPFGVSMPAPLPSYSQFIFNPLAPIFGGVDAGIELCGGRHAIQLLAGYRSGNRNSPLANQRAILNIQMEVQLKRYVSQKFTSRGLSGNYFGLFCNTRSLRMNSLPAQPTNGNKAPRFLWPGLLLGRRLAIHPTVCADVFLGLGVGIPLDKYETLGMPNLLISPLRLGPLAKIGCSINIMAQKPYVSYED